MDILTPLNIPNLLPKASSQQAADFRKSASEVFPFLEYAVHNVLYHANAAKGSGITQTHLLSSFQLSLWIKLSNLLERHKVRRYSEDVSLLYLLGEHNMPNLIRVLPSAISCLEVKKERYGCPLFANMATSSKEATEMLLKRLAMDQYLNVDANGFDGEWNQKIIGRDFKFSRNRGVLSYLAESGCKTAVSFLLKTGKVDVDSKDKDGWTSLWWAAWNGSEAVVKLLRSYIGPSR